MNPDTIANHIWTALNPPAPPAPDCDDQTSASEDKPTDNICSVVPEGIEDDSSADDSILEKDGAPKTDEGNKPKPGQGKLLGFLKSWRIKKKKRDMEPEVEVIEERTSINDEAIEVHNVEKPVQPTASIEPPLLPLTKPSHIVEATEDQIEANEESIELQESATALAMPSIINHTFSICSLPSKKSTTVSKSKDEAKEGRVEPSQTAFESRKGERLSEKDIAAARAMPSILKSLSFTTAASKKSNASRISEAVKSPKAPGAFNRSDFDEPYVFKSEHARLVRFVSHREDEERGYEVLLEDFNDFNKDKKDADSIEKLIAEADRIANRIAAYNDGASSSGSKRSLRSRAALILDQLLLDAEKIGKRENREDAPLDSEHEGMPNEEATTTSRKSRSSIHSAALERSSVTPLKIAAIEEECVVDELFLPPQLSMRSLNSRASRASRKSISSRLSLAKSRNSQGVREGANDEIRESDQDDNVTMASKKSFISKNSASSKKSRASLALSTKETVAEEDAVVDASEVDFIHPPQLSVRSFKSKASQKTTSSRKSQKEDLQGPKRDDKPETIEISKVDSGLSKKSAISHLSHKSTVSMVSEVSDASKTTAVSKKSRASLIQKSTHTTIGVEPAENASELLGEDEEHGEFITKPNASMRTNKSSASMRTKQSSASKKSNFAQESRVTPTGSTAERQDEVEPVVDAPHLIGSEEEYHEFVTKPSISMRTNKSRSSVRTQKSNASARTSKSVTSKSTLSRNSRASPVESEVMAVKVDPAQVAAERSGGEGGHGELMTQPNLSMVSNKSSASKKSRGSLISKTMEEKDENEPAVDIADLADDKDEHLGFLEKPNMSMVSTKSNSSRISATFSKKSREAPALESLEDGEFPESITKPSLSMVSNKSSLSKKSSFSKKSSDAVARDLVDDGHKHRDFTAESVKPSVSMVSNKSSVSKKSTFSQKSSDYSSRKMANSANKEYQDLNAEPSLSMVSNKSSMSRKSGTLSRNSFSPVSAAGESEHREFIANPTVSMDPSESIVSSKASSRSTSCRKKVADPEEEPREDAPSGVGGEELRDCTPNDRSTRSYSSKYSRYSKKMSKQDDDNHDSFDIPMVESTLSKKSGRSKASVARTVQTTDSFAVPSLYSMEEQILKIISLLDKDHPEYNALTSEKTKPTTMANE